MSTASEIPSDTVEQEEHDGRILDQVERILHSENLYASTILRQLFKYLAEKTIAGEADALKEYTVAVEALHKPPSYDPRHDSSVRIHVSRLRQKLSEFYRGEGRNDLVLVDLPKGHFRLTFEFRQPIPLMREIIASPQRESRRWRVPISMWVALICAVSWAAYLTVKMQSVHPTSSDVPAINTSNFGWTPELETIWKPFLDSGHPLVVGIEDPLFMVLGQGSGVIFRNKKINDWNELKNDPESIRVRKVFGNPEVQPSRYMTSMGEAEAVFTLGGLLRSRVPHTSLRRISQVSWQEIANNNVLFVGRQIFFDSQLNTMPIKPELVIIDGGIKNLHPYPGEPEIWMNHFITAPNEEGEVFALVTHIPGPLGNSDIETFNSDNAGGYVGAVQYFSNPRTASALLERLQKLPGGFPKYFQVVLRIKFKDGVPLQTDYVLGRTLH